MAVQNIRGIYEDTATRKKSTTPKTGFTVQQLEKVLGVKMLSSEPDKMDTRADQSRSKWCGNQKTHERATIMEDPQTQCKEGCCFTCNKQGHIAHNCLNKPKQQKPTPPTKGRQAKAKDSNTKSEASSVHSCQPKSNGTRTCSIKWSKLPLNKIRWKWLEGQCVYSISHQTPLMTFSKTLLSKRLSHFISNLRVAYCNSNLCSVQCPDP